VVFDDGTGECVLYVDGELVLQFLKPPNTGAEITAQEIKTIVEDEVFRIGHVNYNDSIARKANAAEAAAANLLLQAASSSSSSSFMEVEVNENAEYTAQYLKPEDILASAPSLFNLNKAEESLVQYISGCDKSNYIEVNCRMIFLREQMGNEFSLSSRKIILQNENNEKKYLAYTTSLQTTCLQNHLTLQVNSLKTFTKNKICHEAWHRLRAVNGGK